MAKSKKSYTIKFIGEYCIPAVSEDEARELFRQADTGDFEITPDDITEIRKD
jgi:hypothetical protein